jgi:hypothetical protein
MKTLSSDFGYPNLKNEIACDADRPQVVARDTSQNEIETLIVVRVAVKEEIFSLFFEIREINRVVHMTHGVQVTEPDRYWRFKSILVPFVSRFFLAVSQQLIRAC